MLVSVGVSFGDELDIVLSVLVEWVSRSFRSRSRYPTNQVPRDMHLPAGGRSSAGSIADGTPEPATICRRKGDCRIARKNGERIRGGNRRRSIRNPGCDAQSSSYSDAVHSVRNVGGSANTDRQAGAFQS